MKLIAGLGNPGPQYTSTRHNIGQRVLNSLSGESLAANLFKPDSFMNSIGPDIAAELKFRKLSPSDLLVIHDELDLPFGETRLQFGRSAAGHHGVESVVEALGTANFWRLRVGIGPRGITPGDQFVLERFTKVEEKKLPDVIEEAKKEVKVWLEKSQ